MSAEHKYPVGSTLVHRGFLEEPVPRAAPRLFVTAHVGADRPVYLCRVLGVTPCGFESVLSAERGEFDEAELAPWQEFSGRHVLPFPVQE
jgi:hypothetical protein